MTLQRRSCHKRHEERVCIVSGSLGRLSSARRYVAFDVAFGSKADIVRKSRSMIACAIPLSSKKTHNVRLWRRQVVVLARLRFDIGGHLARRSNNNIDSQGEQNRNANGEKP